MTYDVRHCYNSNSTDTNSFTIHHIPKNEPVSEIFSLKRFPRVCLPSRTPARSSSRTPTCTLDCPFNNTHACSRLYARPPEFTAFNNKQLLIEIVIEIELVNGKKIEIESNSFFANRNITTSIITLISKDRLSFFSENHGRYLSLPKQRRCTNPGGGRSAIRNIFFKLDIYGSAL